MPNLVRISVDGSEDLLNASMYNAGAVVRLHSAATEAGAYASVGAASIVVGTRIYTIFDANGTVSTWYRTRYEDAGGVTVSDWSASFQAGPEEGNGVCSLYDVKQALSIAATDTGSDEELLELIGEITQDIIGWTGRRFVRMPLSGSSTFLFDIDQTANVLQIPQGIAAMTQLEVASGSQPETGGTYSVLASTEWMLRPTAHERSIGWPATSIVLGEGSWFYPGRNTVRITGALGWATVPADIAGMAKRAVARRFKNRGAATVGRSGDATDIGARWTFSIEEVRRLSDYRGPVIE